MFSNKIQLISCKHLSELCKLQCVDYNVDCKKSNFRNTYNIFLIIFHTLKLNPIFFSGKYLYWLDEIQIAYKLYFFLKYPFTLLHAPI